MKITTSTRQNMRRLIFNFFLHGQTIDQNFEFRVWTADGWRQRKNKTEFKGFTSERLPRKYIDRFVFNPNKKKYPNLSLPSQKTTAKHLLLDIDFHDSFVSTNDVKFLEELGFFVYPSSMNGIHALILFNDEVEVSVLQQIVESLKPKLEGKLDLSNVTPNAFLSIPTLFPKQHTENLSGCGFAEELLQLWTAFLSKKLEDLVIPVSRLLSAAGLNLTSKTSQIQTDFSKFDSISFLRDSIRRSITTAIGRFSVASATHSNSNNYISRNSFEFIPAGEWHEKMRLTGKSYLIPESEIESEVRRLSNGLPEKEIKERIRRTKGDVKHHNRSVAAPCNSSCLLGPQFHRTARTIDILTQKVIEILPSLQRSSAEELFNRRVVVATVIYLIIFRLRLDGGGECYLTYNAIKNAIDWQEGNRELTKKVMKFVYRVISKSDQKVFKKEYAYQQYGMNIYLENEFATELIAMMDVLVENKPQITKHDIKMNENEIIIDVQRMWVGREANEPPDFAEICNWATG